MIRCSNCKTRVKQFLNGNVCPRCKTKTAKQTGLQEFL